jgi:SAM-dependent methyltransferase
MRFDAYRKACVGVAMSDPALVYDSSFFDAQWEGSRASARVVLPLLFQIWRPRSVIDFGCGRGAWLAACDELGVQRLVGIDGEWAAKAGLCAPRIEFQARNLNSEVKLGETFDLAISVEVAEHIEPSASDKFYLSLTGLADAIVFSAAFLGQPGADHINTRPHSFWAEKFRAGGYAIFDLFRPRLWGDDRVEPWYRQNAFLYVKPAHPLMPLLQAAGERPLANLAFVDCVHPLFHFSALEEIARLNGTRSPMAGRPAGTKAHKPGRNDPCYCGSGKKLKHCHGRA